jgi:hypothetical protein
VAGVISWEALFGAGMFFLAAAATAVLYGLAAAAAWAWRAIASRRNPA